MYDLYKEIQAQIPEKHKQILSNFLGIKNDKLNKKKMQYLNELDYNKKIEGNIAIHTYRKEKELVFYYFFKNNNMFIKNVYNFENGNVIKLELENEHCIINLNKKNQHNHLTTIISRPNNYNIRDIRIEIVENSKYLKNVLTDKTNWTYESYNFILNNFDIEKEEMKDLLKLNFDFNFLSKSTIDIFNMLYDVKDNINSLNLLKTKNKKEYKI